MENRATTPQIFALQMHAIRTNSSTVERFQTEDRADRELVSLTQKQMRESLAKAREKGKRGWWNPQECNTQDLETSLYNAIGEDNWIAVINYAAMINARRIADQ